MGVLPPLLVIHRVLLEGKERGFDNDIVEMAVFMLHRFREMGYKLRLEHTPDGLKGRLARGA